MCCCGGGCGVGVSVGVSVGDCFSWRWLTTLVVVLSGRRGGDDVGDCGGVCGRHGGVGGGVGGVCVLLSVSPWFVRRRCGGGPRCDCRCGCVGRYCG